MRQKTVTPETKLILCCSRTVLSEKFISLAESLSGESLNWEWIFSSAAYHGTAAMLYQNLDTHNLLERITPEDTRIRFKDYYYANLARTAKFWKAFCGIDDAFQEQGIGLLPLKGIVLGTVIYHNPALRVIFADIDILVQEKDVASATLELQKIGYTLMGEESGHVRAFKKDSFLIELHWLLLPSWLNRFQMNRLWERATEEYIDNRLVRILSREDMLLSLALQIRHDWPTFRLFRLCDINEILSQNQDILDWGYIRKAANELKMTGTLYFTLHLSRELLFSPLPDEIYKKLVPDYFRQGVLRYLSGSSTKNILSCGLKYRENAWKGLLLKAALHDSPVDCIKILLHKP